MHLKLKEFFEKEGINQTEIADALEVSPPYVNAILNGKKPLGKKNAERLANLYGLSKSFLLTGEGSITNNGEDVVLPQKDNEYNPTVVEQAANIIDLYAGLIKEIESLRADLNSELEAVRKERQEAQRLTTMLHDCLFYARENKRPQPSIGRAAEERKK